MAHEESQPVQAFETCKQNSNREKVSGLKLGCNWNIYMHLANLTKSYVMHYVHAMYLYIHNHNFESKATNATGKNGAYVVRL